MLAFSILMLQIVYSLGGMKQATTSIVPYILGYFIASNSEKLKKYTGGGILSPAALQDSECIV